MLQLVYCQLLVDNKNRGVHEMMVTARRGQTRRKVGGQNRLTQKFAPETFEQLANDLQTGAIPLDRVTISDSLVSGLRVVIRNTGLISYHVHYSSPDGSRPYLKIGDFPKMKVSEARQVAETIRQLSNMGIDPQAGLHERLIRELREQGAKWRPNK